jgi:hypothetical protein
LYSYAGNNPLAYIDPSGLDPCVDGVNPNTGNICATGTASAPPDAPPDPGPQFYNPCGWFGGCFSSTSSTTNQPQRAKIAQAPASQACQVPVKGLGYGATGGASLAVGGGPMQSAGGTFSAGYGKFWNANGGRLSSTTGSYGSAGGFLSATGKYGNYPANDTGKANFALGGFGGVGGGVFFTNAGNSAALAGPFTSYMLSFDIVGLELDLGSGGYVVFSITAAKSSGLGIARLRTNTFYTSQKACGS